MSCPSADRMAAYRKAGVRVRRFGDESFIHPDDRARAEHVDDAAEQGQTKGSANTLNGGDHAV
jgi:hypothetical protein